MNYPWNTSIVCKSDGKSVDAKIVSLHTTLAKQQIDSVWWKGIDDKCEQPDWEWAWSDIVQRRRYSQKYECVAIQSADDKLQGAMALAIDKDGAIVTVEYLATAPWNRENAVKEPIFSDCGTKLMLFASHFSYTLGLGGSINCYSLLDAETFYSDHLQMSNCGVYNDEGSPLYILSSEMAIGWLVREGVIDANSNV